MNYFDNEGINLREASIMYHFNEVDANGSVNLCDLLYLNSSLGLTKRESEILSLMLHHWSIPKVANHLCREEKTINKHLENVKKKMSCATLFILGVKISEHLSKL